MEILDEFDNESPLYVSFCQRISPEDFENQSLSDTQKSLLDLYAEIDQNPEICEPIVRKRRQQAKEEAGLSSYLKAKLSSLFNYTTPLGMEELREEARRLKREMQNARTYALAAKRASSWPLERRDGNARPRREVSPTQSRTQTLATPPMPKIFGPYPPQAEDTDSNLAQPGLLPVNQKSMVDHHPLMLNPGGRHPSFLGCNSAQRMKASPFPRTLANRATESFQGSNSNSPCPSPGRNPPTPDRPRVSDEDAKEEETPGPDPHPPAA